MNVTIYTDGGSDPNPGIGGWAAILCYDDRQQVLTGAELQTTNNRMELQAAIEALKALKEPSRVELYTDSEYISRGITEWIEGWAKKEWKRGKKPIPNADLWKELWALSKQHEIDWRWIKGHAGDPLNERVDQLARQARLEVAPDTRVNDDIPLLYVRVSVKGNPGPGGWGVVLERGDETTQLSGWEDSTTNNRLELIAIMEGLRLVEGKKVQVVTISDYVYQGAANWISGWRKRNWLKKDGSSVANSDLWRRLDRLMRQYEIHWINAKGSQSSGLDEAQRLAADAARLAAR